MLLFSEPFMNCPGGGKAPPEQDVEVQWLFFMLFMSQSTSLYKYSDLTSPLLSLLLLDLWVPSDAQTTSLGQNAFPHKK